MAVTVPGTGGSTVTVSATYNGTSNSAVAAQIAGLLQAASASGSLSITSVSGTETVPPPVTTGGSVNELLLGSVTGGVVTIPSSGSTGYVVVYDSAAPITIHGSANTTVLGGSGNVTIIDPGQIVLGDTATGPGGSDMVQLTAADTNTTVSGNSGNDTITAAVGSTN